MTTLSGTIVNQGYGGQFEFGHRFASFLYVYIYLYGTLLGEGRWWGGEASIKTLWIFFKKIAKRRRGKNKVIRLKNGQSKKRFRLADGKAAGAIA